MSDDLDLSDAVKPAVQTEAPKAQPKPATEVRVDHEEKLLGCFLVDEGETLDRAISQGVEAHSFTHPSNRIIFGRLQAMRRDGIPIGLDTLAEELMRTGTLNQIGGAGRLLELDGSTTAHATYLIKQVRSAQQVREIKLLSARADDLLKRGASPEEALTEAGAWISEIRGEIQSAQKPVPLSEFETKPRQDRSVLLGNRYLNRGDGAVIVGTSGIGKSSITLQKAVLWGLGKAAFGIMPNGPLRSIIIQSEDSDGDVAEVWAGVRTGLSLSLEEIEQVKKNVLIVTDRVNRGERFLHSLRGLVKKVKPDLVWINPLQAFIDGDVTDSQDLGRFLREGLNGINSDSSFGYILVHHTTKPSTGKDRGERLWHEVMYDMAGGAEIINWARAILSLRADTEPGQFNLVLAKRGTRAGVVKMVDAGAGQRAEPVTTIPLQHSKQGGIFWEPRQPTPRPEGESKPGRKAHYSIQDYITVFPKKDSQGLPLGELHRFCEANKPITKQTLHNCLSRWEGEGSVEVLRPDGKPMRYRLSL